MLRVVLFFIGVVITWRGTKRAEGRQARWSSGGFVSHIWFINTQTHQRWCHSSSETLAPAFSNKYSPRIDASHGWRHLRSWPQDTRFRSNYNSLKIQREEKRQSAAIKCLQQTVFKTTTQTARCESRSSYYSQTIWTSSVRLNADHYWWESTIKRSDNHSRVQITAMNTRVNVWGVSECEWWSPAGHRRFHNTGSTRVCLLNHQRNSTCVTIQHKTSSEPHNKHWITLTMRSDTQSDQTQIKGLNVSDLTHTGFHFLWRLSIGIMFFILSKPYILLPYT